jgi:hypothetical protein
MSEWSFEHSVDAEQQLVLANLDARSDKFLHFETSVPGAQLFAGNGVSGFLQWSTENYSIEEWDDGFSRFPAFP